MSLYSQLMASTSGAGGVLSRRFFFTSQSWTVPATGTYRIWAWGGSATGAVSRGSQAYVTGGGAGALCKKTVKLTANDVLTFTVGAGGGLLSITTITQSNGNDGGDTTITGPGISMNAGGGKGGKFSTSLATVLGGLGGVASGGDENYDGGRGGNISAVGVSLISRATGGGALPLYRTGRRGGDILSTSSQRMATGGGGAGGRGGDILSTVTAAPWATGGGGAITNAADASTTSPVAAEAAAGKALIASVAPADSNVPLTPWFPYSGPGTDGHVSSGGNPTANAGSGSGSGGAVDGGTSAKISRMAGIFGGSGGVVGGNSGTAQADVSGVINPFRGGCGGAATAYTAGACTSGPAGDGWIIVERLS